ncbi:MULTISPECIES: SUKH-4 family immunity protein [unclassified Streptomyces]|uniref:SUKH-4 family immunity protein n=1 Tax=unclassified Streptomyces TaxID=2593676 RepID=UPI0034135F6C
MSRAGSRLLPDVIAAFGPEGVVLFPYAEAESSPLSVPASSFLSRVGVPNDYFFISRGGPEEDGGAAEESVHVGSWAADEDLSFDVPEECRSWLIVGHFPCAAAALNPADDHVYAFSYDGDGKPVLIHRDLESLVRSLITLKYFCEEREENEDLEPEELRARIDSFDRLPFSDEASEWNRMYEEIVDGIF